MSNHVDPRKDEYLELEKKLGAAESDLAADLAEADEALDEAAEKRKQKVRAGRARLKRRVTAPPRERAQRSD